MANKRKRGVSSDTLSNKAHVGELGRGSPAENQLQSPPQSKSATRASFGDQLATSGTQRDFCAGCGVSLKKRRRYSLSGPANSDLRDFIDQNRSKRFQKRNSDRKGTFDPNTKALSESDSICDSCRLAFRDSKMSTSKSSLPEGTINLTLKRASASHKKCVFGCSSKSLHIIPQTVRDKVLVTHRFYLPEGSRYCDKHLSDEQWELLSQTATSCTYNQSHIEDMIDSLRKLADKQQSFFNFEFIDDMCDSQVEQWTGINKDQFKNLLSLLPSLTEAEKKNPSTALALYLIKLHTGGTDERLFSLFNIPRSSAERLMDKARNSLLKDFVPLYLGFSKNDREELKTHNTKIARELFLNGQNDKLITIWDGTYVYIQKSSNYRFQRKSFSMHKHRPLIKPFVAVATDGYILDVFGPFPANKSDANIMLELFANKSGLRSFFLKDDVFLVDRGFRDCVATLIKYGYDVRMPFLAKGNLSLSDFEANLSRLVTKCRFVVEAVNGRFKQCFRYFDKVWQNKSLPHLMDDYRIAAAILNAFHETIESDVTDSRKIAQFMLAKISEPNRLASLVESQRLNKQSVNFQTMDQNSLKDFPKLSLDDLRILALGSYQLKQARSYYSEHVNPDGSYEIQVCRHVRLLSLKSHSINLNNPMLIRARIQSRHHNTTKYYIYILIDQDKSGAEAISGHFCQCKNGKRTIGCCAHIMTVLWFLGWGRFETEISEPAKTLNNIFAVFEESEEEDSA
ncbi:unnamed protein product [Euphydryas editha]|uniref:DDE Tnp4 domain-containing protein n=1 Tax=Euphydryas editha TaxID=104508 RepID=A0AAU9UW08_EUPED|nr:unnamed protein product [Euphydryas editha]